MVPAATEQFYTDTICQGVASLTHENRIVSFTRCEGAPLHLQPQPLPVGGA
jgi:hypothetical protein